MRSFSTMLLAGVAQANDFLVTSCVNDSTNSAEMTISVTEAYMDEHHDDLKADFTRDANNNYVNIIPASSLTLDLSDSTYIVLEHQLITAEVVTDNLLVFPGQTTTFKCQYPRLVNVGDSYTVADVADPDPHVGNGELRYQMQSAVADGRTSVTMTAQHGIPGLHTNVQQCEITYTGNTGSTVFPIHSFGADTCIDNRFGTTFGVDSNGVATLDWRTFHFNTGDANQQEHQVTCSINVSDSLTVNNPSSCTCFDQSGCSGTIYQLSEAMSLNTDSTHGSRVFASNISLPRLWELSFDLRIGIFSSSQRDVIVLYPPVRLDDRCSNGWRNPELVVTGSNNGGPVHFNTYSCNDYPWNNGVRWTWTGPSAYDNGVYVHNEQIPQSDVLGRWLSFKIGQREENGVLTWYQTIDGPDDNLETYSVPQTNENSYDNLELRIGSGGFSADGQIRNIMLVNNTPAPTAAPTAAPVATPNPNWVTILDLPAEETISQNNLYQDGFYIPQLYDISFDYKQTANAGDRWMSILQVGTRAHYSQCGDRMPALWTTDVDFRDSSPNEIVIHTCVGTDALHSGHPTIAINLDQWYHFQMGNRENADGTFSWYIKLDGTEIHSVTQPNTGSDFYYNNVKMWIGDPHNPPAPGSVRNIILTDTTPGSSLTHATGR